MRLRHLNLLIALLALGTGSAWAGSRDLPGARAAEVKQALLQTLPSRAITNSPVARGARRASERNAGAAKSSRPATQSVAQAASVGDAQKLLEDRGYRDVGGLTRRGDNYIAQATDAFGIRVRIVVNGRTGEIVGLSRIMPKRK